MAVPMTMMTMMTMMMVACRPLEAVGSRGWMELLHKALPHTLLQCDVDDDVGDDLYDNGDDDDGEQLL